MTPRDFTVAFIGDQGPAERPVSHAWDVLNLIKREGAEQAGVHLTTMQRRERGGGPVGGTIRTLAKIHRALEDAGVEFTAEKRKKRKIAK